MQARVGIVVIGRNEGARLRLSLASATRASLPLVYVDSGSTDDSVDIARSVGVDAVELSASRPFTAARGRNAGAKYLLRRRADLQYVQFLDGDCELCEGWIELAVSVLDASADVAAVCGRVRERHPEASLYNRICDLEWRQPVGDVDNCGGNCMMRVEAFRRAGGFNPEIIAAEDTELCTRLRLSGWRIFSVDADMVRHDAAMLRFQQWFRRAVRAGHALTEGAVMHGRSPARLFRRASRRIAMFGVLLPALSLGLAWPTAGWSLLALLAYPALLVKTCLDLRHSGDPWRDALIYAGHCVAAKGPQGLGQLIYYANRLRGRRTLIIEHKGPARSPARRAEGLPRVHRDKKAVAGSATGSA
jgi:GT2 family glycosyltransferase